jgi:hypothetical protein
MGFYTPMETNAYGFTTATAEQALTGTGLTTPDLSQMSRYERYLYCMQGGPHHVGASGSGFAGRWISGPCKGLPADVDPSPADLAQIERNKTENAALAAGGKSWRVLVDAPGAVSLQVQEFYPPGDVSVANAVIYEADPVPMKPGQFIFQTKGIMPDGSGTRRAYVRFVARYADGQTIAAPVAPLAAGSTPVKAGFTVGSPGVYRITSFKYFSSPLKPAAFKNGAPAPVVPGLPGTGNGTDTDTGNETDTDLDLLNDYEKDLGFFSSLSTPAKVGIAAGAGLGLLALVRAFR